LRTALWQRWFERFQEREGSLGLAPRTLADKLGGTCFADIEAFALDVRRRTVLAGPGADRQKVVNMRLALFAGRFGRGGDRLGDDG
jgi:hypothetical protein